MILNENMLCNYIKFGYEPRVKDQGTHIPNLWEVCHDLEGFIKQGVLIEIPVNCSLAEIFEAEKLLSKRQRPPNRILRDTYFDEDLVIHFKTVPGETLYELNFTKGERTGHSGYFKKIE